MADIDRRLGNIETKMDKMAETLAKIAVQDVRLKAMEQDVYDLKNYQRTCPRAQIKILWWVILPLGVSMLGVAAKLLGVIGE